MQNEKQIEFALTIGDIKAIDRFSDLQNRPLQRPRWIGWGIEQAVFTAFLIVYGVFVGVDVCWAFVAGIDFCFVLTIFSSFRLADKQRKQNYQSLQSAAPQLFTTRLFRIGPSGVFQQSSLGERLTYWSEIANVTETEKAVYFLTRPLGKNGAQEFYTAPRHAFASDAEMSAFADLARGYWSAAHGGATVNALPARAV